MVKSRAGKLKKMNNNNRAVSLPEKLARISALEKQHRLLGVSFAVREGSTVLTEDSADYVIRVIETAVQDIDELDIVLNAKPIESVSREKV